MSGRGLRGNSRPRARRAFLAVRGVVVAVCALALCGGCFGPPMRTGSDSRTIRIVTHEVAPGETLESIADDYYGDPQAASYLRGVNDVPADESPSVGAVLDVPVGEEDISRYDVRTRAKVHYNRGTLLADRRELERAAEEFRSALRIDPRFTDAGHNLGVVLLGSGEVERAVAILRQTAEQRPDDPYLSYALGAALLEAGRNEEALLAFERSIAGAPRHEDARFSRALALERLGRTEEAVFHLDLYLREFPSGRWAGNARSMLHQLGEGAGLGGVGSGSGGESGQEGEGADARESYRRGSDAESGQEGGARDQ